MAYEDKNPSGALAVAIDRESGGAVSFTEMCPDIDWKHVEAVINRRNRRVRASLHANALLNAFAQDAEDGR